MNTEQALRDYMNIGSIRCPALGNEEVVFDDHGLRHLSRKYGEKRPILDQIRRLRLVPLAVRILTENAADVTRTETFKRSSGVLTTAQFWKFTVQENGQIISVVIRQIEDGPKHFFSVMNRKKSTK